MKKLLLSIAIIAIFSLNACLQSGKDVPAKVKTSLAQRFPDATKVKWDKENANEWEAEFKMKNKEYSANFDVDGTWKETEYEIKESKLPVAVKATLANKFAGYDVEDAEVSETPEGKVFELKLENDKTDMEVAIAADGKVVKKEVKKENNKEGDEEREEDHD